MRTRLIDTVRKHASQILSLNPAVDAVCYTRGYNRTTVPAFSNLLKSSKSNEEYALYPRVLFTSYEVNNAELFGSHAILNVRRFFFMSDHLS
jgi:hypothetical protein